MHLINADLHSHSHVSDGTLSPEALGLSSEAAWPNFMDDTVPALREEGWVVEFPIHFRHLVSASAGLI